MICEYCRGTGRGRKRTHPPLGFWPCPECQGSGIVSCCDTAGASMLADLTVDTAEPDWEPFSSGDERRARGEVSK